MPLFLIIILILIGGAGAYYFFFMKKKGGEKAEGTQDISEGANTPSSMSDEGGEAGVGNPESQNQQGDGMGGEGGEKKW